MTKHKETIRGTTVGQRGTVDEPVVRVVSDKRTDIVVVGLYHVDDKVRHRTTRSSRNVESFIENSR